MLSFFTYLGDLVVGGTKLLFWVGGVLAISCYMASVGLLTHDTPSDLPEFCSCRVEAFKP
jgi:hypothetical protein